MDSNTGQVLNLYKRKSETPLQTIERYVALHREFKDVKMTYAGRLDPMAEGVLVVLTGEKNKEREAYTGLDKDYEFEFMLGVETDTFDVLGKITTVKDVGEVNKIIEDVVAQKLKKYLGSIEQKYPPYSSKVIDGTPMFELARKGLLGNKVIPTHIVTVSHIKLISSRTVSKTELAQSISHDINAVSGDFRQKETLALWEKYFATGPESFRIYKARVSCGSGFYVRQLVFDLGRDLTVGAVTISILRSRVGEFEIDKSIK